MDVTNDIIRALCGSDYGGIIQDQTTIVGGKVYKDRVTGNFFTPRNLLNGASLVGTWSTADSNTWALLSTSGMLTKTAKAWVNFNGTGTVTIRSSYNVSSITDNGVGNYTINFATAMSDQNYVVAPFCRDTNDIGGVVYVGQNASYAQNVNSVQLNSSYAGTLYDVPVVSAVIFGN